MEIENHIFQEVLQWRADGGTNDEFWDTALGLALYTRPNRDLYGNFTASSSFHRMTEQELLEKEHLHASTPTDRQRNRGHNFRKPASRISRKDMIEVPLKAPIENGLDEDGIDFWDH
jgi:hypothetical protein